MEGFKLTPSQMLEVAKTFGTSASEMQETSNRIKTAADTLLDAWVGAGSVQFQDDIAEYFAACGKMVDLLTERSDALTSSANAAEELSDALTSQWS